MLPLPAAGVSHHRTKGLCIKIAIHKLERKVQFSRYPQKHDILAQIRMTLRATVNLLRKCKSRPKKYLHSLRQHEDYKLVPAIAGLVPKKMSSQPPDYTLTYTVVPACAGLVPRDVFIASNDTLPANWQQQMPVESLKMSSQPLTIRCM